MKPVDIAILGIRISTVIYYLLIIGFITLGFIAPVGNEEFPPFMCWFVAIFTLPFVVFLEILIIHLKQRRYWAWIGGIVIGAMYAPSLFLVLGVMILWGLLSERGRAEFNTGGRKEEEYPKERLYG